MVKFTNQYNDEDFLKIIRKRGLPTIGCIEEGVSCSRTLTNHYQTHTLLKVAATKY